jgi:hypothetical protein
MSKKAKVALGITTALPMVYMLFFLTVMSAVFISSWKPSEELLRRIAMAHILCILLLIGLLIFYIRHVLKNQELRAEQKTFWLVLLLFGGAISMPIYWYLYIFRASH